MNLKTKLKTNLRATTMLMVAAAGLTATAAAAAVPAPAAVTTSAAGKVTIYSGKALHLGIGNSEQNVITAGPDGALWFTNPGDHAIGRITTTGSPHR